MDPSVGRGDDVPPPLPSEVGGGGGAGRVRISAGRLGRRQAPALPCGGGIETFRTPPVRVCQRRVECLLVYVPHHVVERDGVDESSLKLSWRAKPGRGADATWSPLRSTTGGVDPAGTAPADDTAASPPLFSKFPGLGLASLVLVSSVSRACADFCRPSTTRRKASLKFPWRAALMTSGRSFPRD